MRSTFDSEAEPPATSARGAGGEMSGLASATARRRRGRDHRPQHLGIAAAASASSRAADPSSEACARRLPRQHLGQHGDEEQHHGAAAGDMPSIGWKRSR